MVATPHAHEKFGLPPGAFRHLAVSSVAASFVILYAAKDDPEPILRLYVRGFDEATYRQVDFVGSLNTYQRFVVSPTESALYVLASRVEGRSGWDTSLVRVPLPDGAGELVRVSSPYAGRWWVAEVLGVEGSGRYLHVKVGEERRLPDHDTVVDYSAQRLDLQNAELTTLAPLPAIFG